MNEPDDLLALADRLRVAHHNDDLPERILDLLRRAERALRPPSRRNIVFAHDGLHFVVGFEGQELARIVPRRVGGERALACLHQVVAANGAVVPLVELRRTLNAVRSLIPRACAEVGKAAPGVGAVLRAGCRLSSFGADFSVERARRRADIRFTLAAVRTTLAIANR